MSQKVVVYKDVRGYNLTYEARRWLINHYPKAVMDDEDFKVIVATSDHHRELWPTRNTHSDLCVTEIGWWFNNDRSNSALVACVEALGYQAGILDIVEIPDGVEWYIHIYETGYEDVIELEKVR